jgi:hypothetical protein
VQLGQRARSGRHNFPHDIATVARHPGDRVWGGASLVDELAGAGLSCERVDMADPEILVSGAREESEALCGGESLDIAVFPTAEQADEYGRQAGYP